MTTDTVISPALVSTDPGTRRCEAKPWCGLLARWHVEAPDREATARTMGELLTTLPRSAPSRHACHNHLLGALTEVLAYPLRGAS